MALLPCRAQSGERALSSVLPTTLPTMHGGRGSTLSAFDTTVENISPDSQVSRQDASHDASCADPPLMARMAEVCLTRCPKVLNEAGPATPTNAGLSVLCQ